MPRHAALTIVVRKDNGETVTVQAGQEIPSDLVSLITNPAAFVESEDAPVDAYEEPVPEPEVPMVPDYESMTVAELKEEIDRRNATKAEDEQLPKDGKKDELIAALKADD